MMKRDEMLKAFARQRKDEIVVAVYTAAQELTHIQPNDLNYTFVGAMGQGSSHALGLALGRPDKKVVVFDGDGSLLMNLGSLVTIATQAPKNYVHCLCENGCYETNGSVLTPRSGRFVSPNWRKPPDITRPTKSPIWRNGNVSCRIFSNRKVRFSSR